MAVDGFGRKIDYLRVSITDRCNLRCKYCMPEGLDSKLPHDEILSYEQLIKIITSFAKLGIKKVKITGGEPLIRKDSEKFIVAVKKIEGIKQVTLTTNATRLYKNIDLFLENNIDGINISLDSLRNDRFKLLTGSDIFETKKSIDYLLEKKYNNLKINSLIIDGFNEDEIIDLAKLAKVNELSVRFIELMPIGQAKKFKGVSRDYILDRLENEFGKKKIVHKILGNGPADYITFDNFKGNIGFIDAIDHKFCESCNRVRLTSTGKLKLCLQYNTGVDLSDYAKGEITEDEFFTKVSKALMIKPKENQFKNLEDIKDENTNNMNELGG
ncbi:MAG: GTP 3',8-cyclase MoaA [Tissierellia bacterium]|nr:GTP 3',8-cyclase MoaA [Tissierellia bacterium]